MEQRTIKATEVRNGLRNFKDSELLGFYKLLDDWVEHGTNYSGVLSLPLSKKDLVYQLDKPEMTVVKLSETDKYTVNEPKVSTKVGRNDICNCGSGIKHKKCCLR